MPDSPSTGAAERAASPRLDHFALYRWWRATVVAPIDHERVVARIVEESGWSNRYAFMTLMSAGIAVLGLLLSSPAVVIGAMLISPLMNPILGLGFSLALFDFREMRRSLTALVIGAVAAVAFTALIVLASPLKAPTAEILARTRPNLFDLLVALFAALAGTFAIIRGRGETIVGVAIATALMPPLAVVGYGLATGNMAVLGGALALFATNFLTIALAATAIARFYGFGHYLSGTQSWAQTIVLAFVFVAMGIPLAISLGRIARETVIATQIRSFLNTAFGASARVTQLDIDFDRTPIVVRSVVIAPRTNAKSSPAMQADLAKRLDQPVKLQLDQVLLDPSAGALETQRAELRQASDSAAAEDAEAARVVGLVALAAGVPNDGVTLDRDHHRAAATAVPLPGAGPDAFRVLEQRASLAAQGWHITIVPPLGQLPAVRFADNVDTLDPAARDAVLLSIWEARRWNIAELAVPGLPDGAKPPAKPKLNARRALAIATLLRANGMRAVPAPAAGQIVTLKAASQ
ncbi:DUF389 domain-containing protein [Sphingomonas sp. CARO-RG-8B-R24-01]|uniref:DUF389 domain-containing protein n=1 Tax=Sphingomonas sp. CARO-RG-8B-R24-01 TaxID=2914831 RepID=UPI001F585595|nr:DUF389 domain-containing protein [Sphingomonas sp. CARO-RG-8B-R24-01]